MNHEPRSRPDDDDAPTDAFDVSSARFPGRQVGRASDRTWRVVVSAAVALVLLVAAGIGLLWVSRDDAGASAAPAASTPVSSTPSPDTVDTGGAPVPEAVTAGARRVSEALDRADLDGLAALYHPGTGAASWSTARTRLSSPLTRAGLLDALRQRPSRSPDVAYLYSSRGFGVGVNADGTVAFFGTGQSGRASAPTAASGAASASEPEPTLGIAGWRPYSDGYGEVRPRTANAGGDGTSVVENLRWTSWGGTTARATGTASWVAPDAASYQGVITPAVVIASGLGDCQGHPGYHQITWYFPSRGETEPSADSGYTDLCTPW